MIINTNVSSITAQEAATNTSKSISSSLEKLSTGLKINKASDDASGLAIADKLRTQASSIDQGVANGNSAVTLLQIADKSMAEQSNILDTVKSKLIQANTDTTSSDGREAIRKDIAKLLEQLDNIAEQTNYNGNTLLQASATSQNGSADLSFQIGETSLDTITNTAIRSNTAGLGSSSKEETSFELGTIAEGEYYTINYGGTGSADASGNEITAGSIQYVALAGDEAEDVHAGLVAALAANTTAAAEITIEDFDSEDPKVNVIGATANETLNISATVSTDQAQTAETVAHVVTVDVSTALTSGQNFVADVGGTPISISVVTGGDTNAGTDGYLTAGYSTDDLATEVQRQLTEAGVTSYTVDDTGTNLVFTEASAAGANATITASGGTAGSEADLSPTQNTGTTGVEGGASTALSATIDEEAGTGLNLDSLKALTSLTQADSDSFQAVVDDAITDLNGYRGDVGSTQNQVESAVRNLMTQSTNVKAAESIIRDVDYAQESANFNKQNIISQAGSYAISQANSVQQNVLKLLQ